MNERKATKRALLTSITALVMCVVMLAGTTFAWFTDTASTNVNKIQAGKLDVQLMMKDGSGSWVNAEGKTLNFLQKQADGTVTQNANILWEPGCTYELPELKVVNNGNLNIKCRVEVTGIKKVTTAATPAGTFDLNDAITWSATGLTLDQNFTLDTASNKEKEFTISGTMKTTAGNDYQGLSIDGVSITVYATQAEGEFDSNRDDYDKDATYTRTNATVVDETTGKTVTLEKGKSYTVGTATITVSDSGDITYVNSGSGQKVTINTDGGNLTVDAANDTVYHYGRVGIVTVTAVAGNSYHEFGDASVLAIAKGRAVIEKSDAVKVLQVTGNEAIIAVPQNVVVDTKLEKDAGVSEIVIKTVDSSDQVVTVTKIGSDGSATTTEGENQNADTPKELSKIIGTGESGKTTIGVAEDYVAMIGSTGYTTLSDAVAAAENGNTITLLRDSTENGVKVENKGFVLDLNGHTLKIGNPLVGSTGTETNGFQLNSSAGNVTFKNGTLTTEEAYILIQNYCNLTLDNMVLDGRNIPSHAKYPNRVVRYTLSNNCGNVTINNSVIYAPEKLGVAFDVCRYASYPAVSVTVTGDSVINGDVEVSGEIGEGQSRQLTINSGMFNGKFVVVDKPANITISGGTFTADPTSYLATGYTATKGSDGVWTVTEKSN